MSELSLAMQRRRKLEKKARQENLFMDLCSCKKLFKQSQAEYELWSARRRIHHNEHHHTQHQVCQVTAADIKHCALSMFGKPDYIANIIAPNPRSKMFLHDIYDACYTVIKACKDYSASSADKILYVRFLSTALFGSGRKRHMMFFGEFVPIDEMCANLNSQNMAYLQWDQYVRRQVQYCQNSKYVVPVFISVILHDDTTDQHIYNLHMRGYVYRHVPNMWDRTDPKDDIYHAIQSNAMSEYNAAAVQMYNDLAHYETPFIGRKPVASERITIDY